MKQPEGKEKLTEEQEMTYHLSQFISMNDIEEMKRIRNIMNRRISTLKKANLN